MGSGDELRLLFDASSIPELLKGWTREFILKVGWLGEAIAMPTPLTRKRSGRCPFTG